MTVATNSREFKKVIKAYMEATADSNGAFRLFFFIHLSFRYRVAQAAPHQKQRLPPLPKDGLPFKLNDFGCRGVSSMETAAIGGAAHLVNFLGTDTVPALVMLRDYYGADMAGFSIPASEHSTITAWGREHEVDAMRNMLEQFPDGLMACVSDSFDIWYGAKRTLFFTRFDLPIDPIAHWIFLPFPNSVPHPRNACTELWGKQLKNAVVERGEKGGILVVRPDSGDPATVSGWHIGPHSVPFLTAFVFMAKSALMCASIFTPLDARLSWSAFIGLPWLLAILSIPRATACCLPTCA